MDFIKNLSFDLNTNNVKANLVLFMLILLNTIFTYYFMSNGMPDYPNVDEKININIVKSLLARDTFELAYFKYPSLSFYYPKIFLDFFSFEGIYSFNELFRIPFFLLHSLIPLFLYVGSKNIFNANIAIITVALYVFAPSVHAIYYYGGPDLMLLFVSSLIFYLFSLIWIEKNEKRSILLLFPLLSILIGLATAAKYTGILYIVLAIYLFFVKKLYKDLNWVYIFLLQLLLIAVTFFVLNPYALLDTKKLILDFLWNVKHYNSYHLGLHSNNGFVFYLNNFLFHYNYFGIIIYLIGIYYLAKNNKYLLFGLIVIPILLIVKLSTYNVFIDRNLSPIILFYFIVSGIGLYSLIITTLKENRSVLKLIYILFLTSFFLFSVYNFTFYFKNSFKKDGREMSSSYIKKNIPHNSTIYMLKGMYSMGYLPKIDNKYYKIKLIGHVPKILNKNDFFIDTSYHYFRYLKKKDKLFFTSDSYIKKDLSDKYLDSVKIFSKVKTFNCMSQFSIINYPILFNLTGIECSGPNIDIYTGGE